MLLLAFRAIMVVSQREQQRQAPPGGPRTPGERSAMERLTTWNGKKYVLPQGRTSDGESFWRIIAERLAAYENTGMTPEEIEAMKERDRHD